MGSISSVNPGVADLLQTLSNVHSPVANSPTVAKALANASTADIVQLSAAANELQGLDAMFGLSTTPTTSVSSTLLTALEDPGGSSLLSTASTGDQLANYQATLQSELTQGLFGTTTGTSGTLLNTVA